VPGLPQTLSTRELRAPHPRGSESGAARRIITPESDVSPRAGAAKNSHRGFRVVPNYLDIGRRLLTARKHPRNHAALAGLASDARHQNKGGIADGVGSKGGAGGPHAAGSRPLSHRGLRFIATWEGFRQNLYNDTTGNATIGYGHKVHSGVIDGSESAEFQAGISRARGEQILGNDASVIVREVQRMVTVPVTQTQFDALVSLGFNYGTGGLEHSGVVSNLNAGRMQAAGDAFRRLSNPTRRAAEAELFLNGRYTGQGGTEIQW
jgi:lysozyme